jgi:NAD(P)-dependent dehydrogenase (short-subunit alcohol dehydrogenase family)
MSQPSYKNPFTRVYRKAPYPRISPEQPALSAAGKTALITAGHTGIGFAVATSFARADVAHLILVGRRQELLDGAKDELSTACPATKVHVFVVSILDEKGIQAMFEVMRQEIAEPDILVTSAAYFAGPADVLGTPMQQMWTSFETNVKGNLNIVCEFLDAPGELDQKIKKDKVILDISSAATHVFMPKTGAYAASKLAFTRLMATTQTEALIGAPSEGFASIRIHSFHPGVVLTDSVRGFGHDENTTAWDDVQLSGHFAVWLASPEAEFLKGRFVWANWDVDELIERKEEIVKENLLKIGIVGRAEFEVKV